ncbi:hypothetical protein HanHA300_Chr16g0615691 [Helianthus annuus]|nr:hypothetical protein HanHA300_Chr16g0615691 [Helianthus annuus]KAJ0460925.1 hypothetical protein HanHA89_Chr16g0666481 [Helianthus annuus]KAJ0641356.1 hypothetical protein HanLR1_Chr16g0626251 [Helianthus annuus]KAJ0645253.1 hypothetical protein HanOQP8_Chr16g0621781 [Helianthus annuus]
MHHINAVSELIQNEDLNTLFQFAAVNNNDVDNALEEDEIGDEIDMDDEFEEDGVEDETQTPRDETSYVKGYV